MASWRNRIAAAVRVDEHQDYRRGRGRRTCTPDPVIEAYTTTGAIHRPCTDGCGAEAEQICRWPDGTPRKLPCFPRLRENHP